MAGEGTSNHGNNSPRIPVTLVHPPEGWEEVQLMVLRAKSDVRVGAVGSRQTCWLVSTGRPSVWSLTLPPHLTPIDLHPQSTSIHPRSNLNPTSLQPQSNLARKIGPRAVRRPYQYRINLPPSPVTPHHHVEFIPARAATSVAPLHPAASSMDMSMQPHPRSPSMLLLASSGAFN